MSVANAQTMKRQNDPLMDILHAPPIPWLFAITQMKQSKVKVAVKEEPPYITLSACIMVIITQRPLPPNRHI